MNWLDGMKRDAITLAFPGAILEDGDRIEVKMRYSEDEWLSSATFEPGFFAIDVEVWRPTERRLGDGSPGPLVFKEMTTGQHYEHAMQRVYLGFEAQEFFVELMKRGSR